MDNFGGKKSVKCFQFWSQTSTSAITSKSFEGERIARISYSPLACVNIASKTAKDRSQKRGSVGEDLWDVLRHHLRRMQLDELTRISHRSVKAACEARMKNLTKNVSLTNWPASLTCEGLVWCQKGESDKKFKSDNLVSVTILPESLTGLWRPSVRSCRKSKKELVKK